LVACRDLDRILGGHWVQDGSVQGVRDVQRVLGTEGNMRTGEADKRTWSEGGKVIEWEYKFISAEAGIGLEDRLEKLGKQGWQLVMEYNDWLIFKRPIEEIEASTYDKNKGGK